MRLHQLSFRLQNFDKDGNTTFHGYIDANKPEEVLQQLLIEANKVYAPDKSFEDFCNSVFGYNEKRFGVTETSVAGRERKKI